MHKVMTSWNVSRAGLIEQKKSESCQEFAPEESESAAYMFTRKNSPPSEAAISPNSTVFGRSNRTGKRINEGERAV